MIEEARLRTIIEFNFSPEKYCHPEWFNLFPEKNYISSLCSRNDTSHLVSKYILEYFNISDSFHFNFETKIHELALLDLSELNILVELIAIALYKNEVRRIISGKLLRQLYSNLNSVSLAYLDSEYLFENEPPSLPAIDRDNPLATILPYGSTQLINALKNEPDAIKNRVLIKLGPMILKTPAEYSININNNLTRKLVIHAFDFIQKNKN